MQTILGSTGVIGKYLSKILPQYTDKVRLVSRNPGRESEHFEFVAADLLNRKSAVQSINGSDVAYLVVGIEYDKDLWIKKWPLIMQNVIDACEVNGTKLVFFDNVYAYGRVNGWMKEDSPRIPVSVKGRVRLMLENMIMEEVEKGRLTAAIIKSADFYGPNANSIVSETVFNKLKSDKKPLWLGNPDKKHSLTYVKDAALATALIGNSNFAYNQVWHAPTDKEVLTGREIISLAAQFFNKKPDFVSVPKWILKILGPFNKIIQENNEMMYQLESDYLFDSSKFEKAFKIFPTRYRDGFLSTINYIKSIEEE